MVFHIVFVLSASPYPIIHLNINSPWWRTQCFCCIIGAFQCHQVILCRQHQYHQESPSSILANSEMEFTDQIQQLYKTTTKGERIWLAFYVKRNHNHNNHCTCLRCSMQSGCCWSSFEVQVWKVANKVFFRSEKFGRHFCNLASKYFLA